MKNNQRWTDEMRKRLAVLWNAGRSATAIAISGEFPGFTRNAIVGEVFRLRGKGMELRMQRVAGPKKKKKRVRRPAFTNYAVKGPTPPAGQPKPREPKEPPIAPASRRLPLLALGSFDCRFIVATDPGPLHLYCAVDASAFVADDGGNCYCAFHQRLMRAH